MDAGSDILFFRFLEVGVIPLRTLGPASGPAAQFFFLNTTSKFFAYGKIYDVVFNSGSICRRSLRVDRKNTSP